MVTHVVHLGRQPDVRFYSICSIYTRPGVETLARNNLSFELVFFVIFFFVSTQFSFMIQSFILSFKAALKRYLTLLSGCNCRMWFHIYFDCVLCLNILYIKIYCTLTIYFNNLTLIKEGFCI